MADTRPIYLRTELYTQMRIHFAEITCAAASNSNYVNQEIYKVSRPTLVDYIVMTEESLSVNGAGGPGVINVSYGVGTNAMMLNDLRINWWVTDRARAALRKRTPFLYNTYVDGDRSYTGLATFGAGLIPESYGLFTWKFRRPWVYKPGSSFVVDWSYPLGQAIGILPNIAAAASPQIIFYGVGQTTRHRRIFEMQLPAFVAGSTGSSAQPEFVSQLTDEPYDIDGMSIVAGDSTWLDYRIFNMVRLRINPAQSEPISDDPVPIIMYGIDGGPPRRAVIYQPTGGPLLLQPGQSIGWEIDNTNAAIGTNFQIGLVGRTLPREAGR